MRLRILATAAALAAVCAVSASAQNTFGGGGQQQPQQQPYPPQNNDWGQQPQPAPGGYPGSNPYPAPGPANPGGWGQQPQPQPGPANSGGWGQQPQPGPGAGGNLDQLMQMERQDFGVRPTSTLHSGPMHGPTPSSIPGGQVVTTKGLVALVQGKQAPYFLFDVLGGPETLPGAMPAAWLAQPGDFRDQTQQQMAQMFQQGTGGRKDITMVFYCLSTQCWMSYNAALRAVNAGYTNVLWYRGGIEAWKMAGLPTQPAQQGYPPQQGGQGGYPQQPQQPSYPQQPQYPQQQGYPQQ